MTAAGDPPSPSGGHAGERQRQFEAERGLSGRDGESPGGVPLTGGKTFLRQEEFRLQRGLDADPRTLTPEEDPGEADEMRRALQEEKPAAAPAATGPAWQSLGPAGIPNAQTYGTGPGSHTTVAGRVSAIAVDPSDSAHLLVGSAAGGIWETRDTGASWAPRTDDQPTLSVGALAFDPTEPSTVYAGTGEGNSAYRLLGRGILRSTDGGASWALIAQARFARVGFYRLIVDPQDPKRLLAATTGGLAISPDGGTTWTAPQADVTWDVSLAHPEGEEEILFTTPDGLFAQRGAAAPAHVPLPGLPPKLLWWGERMAVAHVPTDPGQAFVFAAAGGSETPAGGLQPGAARMWHRAGIDEPFKPVALPSIPTHVGGRPADALRVDQAAYDWYLAIPERSDDVIYLGAIELVKGERHHADWSWSDISSREVHGDSIHADQHTMAFDPQDPDILYAGNDGGIFRSPDGGVSWKSLNAGLEISEVEYLTQRPDEPTWILAGLQDNGSVRREAAGQWSQVGLGDGGDCATDMTKPDICYVSHYAMFLERSEHRGSEPLKNITPAPPGEFPGLFYAPLEVNGDLVVKAGAIVCLSTNRGDTWARVQLPPGDEGRASRTSALAIPSPGRVLVGTEWGDLFRIDAAGNGWTEAHKLSRPKSGYISDLLVDADVPHRCWATFSHPASVLRSDDEGASWTDVTANLSAAPVNAIVTDPAARDRVWIASDVGVFESKDAGGSWSEYGTDLPNALAEDLVFYAPDRLLRVGTRSRGVWEASVS